MAVIEYFAPAAETDPVPEQAPLSVPAHSDPSSISLPAQQVPSSSSLPAHQVPYSISPDAWSLSESAAAAVVSKTQPTFYSECLRFAIIRYLKGLIRLRVGCENLCRDRPSTGCWERGRNHFLRNNHRSYDREVTPLNSLLEMVK